MDLPIKINHDKIAVFCLKHHLTRLSFFGSVLTDRFGPDSDVDVLFEYHPEHIPSLFDLAAMEEERTAIPGRKADMRRPRDLNGCFRDDVVRKAVVQYAA